MLAEDFAEAFVHRRAAHQVCGISLRPFSRWHAANLDFVESPLAAHSKRRTNFYELWLAAFCCTLRYPRTINTALAGFHPIRRLRRMRAENSYFQDPTRQLNAFTAYLTDYSSRPEILPSDEATGPKVPWYFHEVCALLRLESGLTKAEAWDMPVGEGAWWYIGHSECAGAKLDLVTPADRAHELSEEEFAENERQEALIRAEDGA